MAQKAAHKFVDLGAVRVVEAWGDDVPKGEVTDYARAVKARFINNGQSCVNAKRFIVETSVAERFVGAFLKQVKKLRIGERPLSMVRLRAISVASIAPNTNAPVNPAMIRATVDSTSENCDHEKRIWNVRRKMSFSDGKINAGMNSERSCHASARMMNGTVTVAARRLNEEIPSIVDHSFVA